MSQESRVEDLLATGVEEPVQPMSEVEAILRGEGVTPHSRVADLLLQYNPSDVLIDKTITQNGTYIARNDNADGYSKVVVNTPVAPTPVYDQLDETITQNGDYSYTPTHDAFSSVDISVEVPQATLGTKAITENGTYNASSDNMDGYSSVTVTVQSGSTAEIKVHCIGLAGETVTATAPNSETYTKSVTTDDETVIFNHLSYAGVWTISNSANQLTETIDNSFVNSSAKNGTQLMSSMNNLRVSTRCSSGSINNNVYSFSIDDYVDDWSGTSCVVNSTAVDLTDVDDLAVTVNITDQADYGYFWVLVSSTYYEWGGSEWPSLLYYVPALAKISESGVYQIDVSSFTGNNYIYLMATAGKDSVNAGSEDNTKNGLITGTVTSLIAVGAVEPESDPYMFLEDGEVPSNQGTTYLTPDKPFTSNTWYNLAVVANNKTFIFATYWEGNNGTEYSFKPNSSTTYYISIYYDGTVKVRCSSGSWYAMDVCVTQIRDDYIPS